MNFGRWKWLGALVALVVVLAALLWLQREGPRSGAGGGEPKQAGPAAPPYLGQTRSTRGDNLGKAPATASAFEPETKVAKLARLRAEIPADAISPIAAELNAPSGTPRHDLEILDEVLMAWRTNFPRDGNPVGDNDEITVALAGDNRLKFAFISPAHPAINARGELCDRWGTPFRFHAVSGTDMELRSAGPDRKFGTADDVEFAPSGNVR